MGNLWIPVDPVSSFVLFWWNKAEVTRLTRTFFLTELVPGFRVSIHKPVCDAKNPRFLVLNHLYQVIRN